MLVDTGRSGPRWAALFRGQMVLDCRKKGVKDEGVSLVDIERRHTVDGLEKQYRDLLRIVPGNSQERDTAGKGVSSTGRGEGCEGLEKADRRDIVSHC